MTLGAGGARVVAPTRAAVRRRVASPFSEEAYDDSQESGRNGLLRWAKDNGGLLRIPIDRERTVPGGEVRFKADDANITDWIQRRLNGRRLVLTKAGNIVLKGRNGKVEFMPADLRDVFGLKFREGSNDGLQATLAAEIGNAQLENATIEQVVESLARDRANYGAWVARQKAVRRGERPPTDEERYYLEQAEAEEAFRRREFEIGGEGYSGAELMDGAEARDAAFAEDAANAAEIADAIAEGRFKREIVKVNPKLREEVARLTSTDRTRGEIARRNEIVEFSDTPPVLRLVGMPEARIISRADILRKIKEKHFISDEIISELPEAYAAPVAVFRDGKNFIVLTDREAKTSAGASKPVMVYLKKSNDKGVDNFLASAYAREPAKEKTYAELAKAGNLLYFDKGKAARLNLEGETLSQLTPRSLSGSVKTPEDLSSPVSVDSVANPAGARQGGRRVTAADPDIRFSRGGLYTGSAADYEKPSLHAVGTGEGSQVYGWGLYASDVRGIAEGYAKRGKDAAGVRALYKGRRVDENADADARGIASAVGYVAAHPDEARSVEDYYRQMIASYERKGALYRPFVEDARRQLARYEAERADWGVPAPSEHLYEQTWFTDRDPGDESHLLNWYGTVGEENLGRVRKSLEREGLLEGDRLRERSGEYGAIIFPNEGDDGQTLYQKLVWSLGGARAASEFLARAGIDGVKYPADSYGKPVKDGDEVGWNYVSFRDDNIRVDHKWRDGEMLFKRGEMTELAKSKVGEWAEGVTADGVRVAVERRLADGVKSGAYRVKREGDAKRIAQEAMRFYRRFSRKTVMLSDGRCVYFVPDARAKGRGLDNEEAWAEYAIHAVTSSGRELSDGRFERLYNPSKAADIWRIENVLKAEKCALDTRRGGENDIAFYGKGSNGKPIRIITKFDEKGNIYADLTEVTVVNTREEKVPPLKPLAEVVSQAHGRGALLTSDGDTIANPAEARQVARFGRGGVTGSVFRYSPGASEAETAIGDTENGAAGLAGGAERAAALRPWTRPGSPCAEARPIAFDAADLVAFWRKLADGGRMRVVKGDHVPGRKDAVGVNAGSTTSSG